MDANRIWRPPGGGALEHVLGAVDVDAQALEGPLVDHRHADCRRQVVDEVAPADEVIDELGVEDRATHQAQVVAPDEVVQVVGLAR